MENTKENEPKLTCHIHGEHLVEEGCVECEELIEANRLVANDKAQS